MTLSIDKLKILFLPIALLCCSIFSSCASQQGSQVILNQMIEGKELFNQKQWDDSKELFFQASTQINSVWDKPEEIKKVKQFWYEEAVKSFKGEPYERSMLFFYLGILFLKEKDYGNAQAAFGQAILQDAFAEEEQHRSDFAIAYFLQAYSQHYLDSQALARQNLNQFQELKENFLEQNFEFGNSIFIIETGAAPKKVKIGRRGEYLGYQRGNDDVAFVEISLQEESLQLFPLGDVFWQASSRGGRPIDAIAKNKVFFKDVTQGVSDFSLHIASDFYRFGSSNDDELAVAFLALGIGAQVLSEVTKTEADTRYWHNLPNYIFLKNLDLPAGEHWIEIKLSNSLGGTEKTITEKIIIEEGTSNIFYWKD